MRDAHAIGRHDTTFSRELRGFGAVGLLAVAVIAVSGEPLGGLLVLGWATLSQTDWQDIGYVRPRSWARSTIAAAAGGCALKLFLKAVVMPLLAADPVNRAYAFLAGNTAAAVWFSIYVVAAAGFSEETVFRGFAFERLGRIFGTDARARTIIVALTTALFAAAHYANQGVAGVEQAAITGAVFGTTYALSRQIWPVMVAHAAFDLTAVAIIYWNLETTIAQLIFK